MDRWARGSGGSSRYYIRGSALSGFVELVTAAGGDPAPLLQQALLSTKAPDQPDELVPWVGLCQLLELAAEALDRPAFGIDWALSIPDHFPNAGPTALLAYFSDTFREWIETSICYWRHHTNASMLQLIDDGASNDVVLRLVMLPSALPMRQKTEYMLANTCRMARSMTGMRYRNPSLVRFRHPKPADTTLHEQIFGCPVTFAAPHNDIAFDRRLLDQPPRGGARGLRKGMDQHIRHRLRQMPASDRTIATVVAVAIRSFMGTNRCSCELVAGSLGLSAKKLQRLLSQEGTSFSSILDDVRRAMAVRLLSGSAVPISRIAGLLEYSTAAPFILAFKRWTGVSPRAFRKSLAGPSQDGSE